MGSGARKVALCVVALLLTLSGSLASFAQSRQMQNNWQQQQFWQQQRNQQQFLQQQQKQQAEKAQREQRLREAEKAARQAESQRVPANDNLPGASRSAGRSSTYARPPTSAVRATPPLDAAKLTPAQIKAGFKGQFANGKALVTVEKKTIAINPNGITGKPRAVAVSSKPKAKPGPAITTRLTALHTSGRPHLGGKEPPGGQNYTIVPANDNRKIWYFREPIGSQARAKAIADFMQYYGVSAKYIGSYLKGHDLDKPIGVRHIKKGDKIIQWGSPSKTGQWFSVIGESWERLGIKQNFDDGTPRQYKIYRAKEDIFVLESIAKDFSWDDGVISKGGGTQFFTFETEKLEMQYD